MICVAKTDVGKWNISGLNTYSGTTKVYQGTLVMGADSALGTNTLVMSGGTLDAGIYSQTAAPLNVASSSTINLGSVCQLLFNAQRTNAWTGDLAFTGTPGLTSVRFYPEGVTTSQLARITYAGKSLSTNENGYLVFPATAGRFFPSFNDLLPYSLLSNLNHYHLRGKNVPSPQPRVFRYQADPQRWTPLLMNCRPSACLVCNCTESQMRPKATSPRYFLDVLRYSDNILSINHVMLSNS